MVKQFSVFLENSPGRLANLMDIIEKNKITLVAMSIAEAGNYGILRMIVSDGSALEIMREANMAVNQAEVLLIDINQFGTAVRSLSDQHLNVEYAYTMNNGRVVLKVSDYEAAIHALGASGVKIYQA